MIFDTEYIQEDNRIPKGCVLMCSCDSLYFEEHAPALIHSANYFKENLHIHIVNESLAAKNLKNKINWHTQDIGLFLRDPLPGTIGWEKESTNVAAGILSFNGNMGYLFLEELRKKVLSYEKLIWFVDQNAIWKTYQDMRDRLSIFVYDNKIMDWEFKNDTVLWTGKGPRKHDNPTYVERKKHFTEIFYENLHS